MPEELRIIVTDDGTGADQGGAPSAPGGRAPSVPAVPTPPSAQPPTRVPPSAADPGVFGRDAERATRRGISTAASVGAAVAGGRVGQAAAVGSGALSAIAGPIGIAAAAAAAALGVATVAVKSFASAVKTQVSELAGFSPAVALAQAETDIRREMAQIRRAQRIGPGIADAERVRSRFESRMTDLGTEIIQILLDGFERIAPAVEGAIVVLERLTDFLEKNGTTLVDVASGLGKFLFPSVNAILKILGAVRENTEKDADELGDDPLAAAFMAQLPPNPAFWPAGQPLPNAPVVAPGV